MKISHFEPSYYAPMQPGGVSSRSKSLKVFVLDEKGEEKFWGYMPEEWVNAIVEFGSEDKHRINLSEELVP